VIEPLRLSLDVACPPEHAFAIWTERASLWWPPTHKTGDDPAAEVIFEPRPGGRVFERTRAGVEIDWGEVTAWEPPRRLAYLWHIRADRADATDVEIRFVDKGDGTTRVEIEHAGWERLGARGPDWRQRNVAGWDGVLPHFAAACAR
jgi:uncharacterized protein YndB with AHSA1/START domain